LNVADFGSRLGLFGPAALIGAPDQPGVRIPAPWSAAQELPGGAEPFFQIGGGGGKQNPYIQIRLRFSYNDRSIRELAQQSHKLVRFIHHENPIAGLDPNLLQ